MIVAHDMIKRKIGTLSIYAFVARPLARRVRRSITRRPPLDWPTRRARDVTCSPLSAAENDCVIVPSPRCRSPGMRVPAEITTSGVRKFRPPPPKQKGSFPVITAFNIFFVWF